MAQEQQQKTTEEKQQETTETAQSTSAEASEKAGLQRGEREGESRAIERTEGQELARPELWSHPFAYMQRMMDEMDRMFTRFTGAPSIFPSIVPSIANVFAPIRETFWSPAIETFEREGRVVLRADLPGLERKDVKVEVKDDELVISGQRKHVEEERARGRYYSERKYGSFERRIALPVDVDPESIEASFDNGVLEVSLPIPEQKAKTKTIEVRSGGQPEGGPRSVH